MKAVRLTFATIALSAMGFIVQASEITEFPLATTSNVTRAAIKADTKAANKAGQLRHDLVGTSVMPMSAKTREQVRMESAAARSSADAMAGAYFVGGM
jgi:hypothetical protein